MKLSSTTILLLFFGTAGLLRVDSFTTPFSIQPCQHVSSRLFAVSVPDHNKAVVVLEQDDETLESLDDILAAQDLCQETSLLEALGFTAYGSKLIYEVAELRKLVDTHSRRVRDEYYGGKPATKQLFGMIPWGNEEMVEFQDAGNIFGQPVNDDCSTQSAATTSDLFFDIPITASAVADFILKNKDLIRVKEDGSFELKQNKDEPPTKAEISLLRDLKKLQRLNKIRVVAFDDKFQDSELLYAIAINDYDNRISLIFRGSVTGGRDWPTNLKFQQNSIEELVLANKDRGSDFISLEQAEQMSDVKLHRGFANYLFADLATDGIQLYRRYWSKFDKIVSTLEAIYEERDENGDLKYADYQLCISGHSLGGALAQLMAFVMGSSAKCREIIPNDRAILAVTYASPCVGNEAFSEAMYELEEKDIVHHVRFSNQGDIVPVGFSLPIFGGYTQSGCNFYLRDGTKMELGGFNNTQTFWSEVNLNAAECHSMESHQANLFYKDSTGKNVNAEIWRRYLHEIFESVKKGVDLDDIPDTRPYEDMVVAELKEELRARELAVSGRKAELVERLRDSDKHYIYE